VGEEGRGPSPNIKGTAEAVEGLVKAVPIYQDLVQPTAQEVGKVMARTVHAALAPLRVVVWGVEQIEGYVESALTKRLKGIPPDRIQTPEPTIAGPALEALRFAGKEETLRELYANLLATAMDRETAERAHPAFVVIIKQLSPDEAKILRLIPPIPARPIPVLSVEAASGPAAPGMSDEAETVLRNFTSLPNDAGCTHPELIASYLGNFERLGLIVRGMVSRDQPRFSEVFGSLQAHPDIVEAKRKIAAEGRIPTERPSWFYTTNFGRQFLRACVVEPDPT
jgi:hypothetical protein